jgi:outer membrane protein
MWNRLNGAWAEKRKLACILILCLVHLMACTPRERYTYQHIKEEHAKPKAAPGLLDPVRTCPLPPPEEVLRRSGTLTLKRAIEIALHGNPDVDMALARIQQAEALLDEAMSAFWPVISVYGEYIQGNAPSAYLFKTIDQRRLPAGTDFNDPGWFENYELGVQGRLNLFNGGRDYLRRRMADTGLDISQLDRQSVENGLVTSVIHAYYSALAAQKYVAIARSSVDTVAHELDMVKVRYHAGGGLKSDVLSLEVALAQAKEDLIRAQNNKCLSLSSLAHIMGLDPDTPIVLSDDQDVPVKVPAGYEEALMVALAHRPELQRTRLQVVQSKRRLDMARSQFLPRLDAQARLYGDDPGFSFDWDRRNWTAGIILNWDVFTGFQRTSQVAKSRAVLEEMLAADRKATLGVQLEVKSAFLRHAEARARWKVSEASVAQAEESLRLVQKQYDGGSATITRYLEAELAWNRSRLRATTAFYDRQKTAATIGRAIGYWAGDVGGERE